MYEPSPTLPGGAKPRMGDVVTFTYDSFSPKSIPTRPKIYRIRTDTTWKEILRDFAQNNPQIQPLAGIGTQNTISMLIIIESSRKTLGSAAPVPFNYWSAKTGMNMRAYFERFARENKFDPLIAENWYAVPAHKIYNDKV